MWSIAEFFSRTANVIFPHENVKQTNLGINTLTTVFHVSGVLAIYSCITFLHKGDTGLITFTLSLFSIISIDQGKLARDSCRESSIRNSLISPAAQIVRNFKYAAELDDSKKPLSDISNPRAAFSKRAKIVAISSGSTDKNWASVIASWGTCPILSKYPETVSVISL